MPDLLQALKSRPVEGPFGVFDGNRPAGVEDFRFLLARLGPEDQSLVYRVREGRSRRRSCWARDICISSNTWMRGSRSREDATVSRFGRWHCPLAATPPPKETKRASKRRHPLPRLPFHPRRLPHRADPAEGRPWFPA